MRVGSDEIGFRPLSIPVGNPRLDEGNALRGKMIVNEGNVERMDLQVGSGSV